MPSRNWWRTVFWLIPAISLYTLVLGALSLASLAVDRRGRLAHGCARTWAWLILVTTGVRTSVRGAGQVDRRTPYVVVCNHQSIYDIPVLFVALPLQLRIIAKASLGRFPVLGWHLRWTGHLLVDRARAGVGALKQVARVMGRGHSLIAFPEGTRSVDGRVGRFRRGLFLLAIEAGLPVVPVAVSGTHRVMRKGMLTTRPGAVALVVHPPMPTGGLTRADAAALAERVRGVIAASVSAAEGREPDSAPSLRGAPCG